MSIFAPRSERYYCLQDYLEDQQRWVVSHRESGTWTGQSIETSSAARSRSPCSIKCSGCGGRIGEGVWCGLMGIKTRALIPIDFPKLLLG